MLIFYTELLALFAQSENQKSGQSPEKTLFALRALPCLWPYAAEY